MKKIKISITYEYEIDAQILEDTFVTAIEGGSNYWMSFDDDTINRARIIMKKEGVYFSEAIFKMVLLSQKVTIIDTETEEVLGTLSLNGIKKGLRAMATAEPSHFRDLAEDNSDAETSDVAMQYFVLGEVVYG